MPAPRSPRLPTGRKAHHTEGDTVRAILQFLHARRVLAWRINTGAVKIDRRFLRFGAVGMSDIIGVLTVVAAGPGGIMISPDIGQFFAIEVKSAKGKLTPRQQSFLDQVNAAGGKALMARSVDDVKQALGL